MADLTAFFFLAPSPSFFFDFFSLVVATKDEESSFLSFLSFFFADFFSLFALLASTAPDDDDDLNERDSTADDISSVEA